MTGKLRTISDTIKNLTPSNLTSIAAPKYTGKKSNGIALAVESMKRHTTDEGWQIMQGLEYAGYVLCGDNLEVNCTNVPKILELTDPGVVFVQDQREWDFPDTDFRDPKDCFHNSGVLGDRPDLFKVTILKDAQARPWYHAMSAQDMGVNAWVIYYHPDIVKHVSGFVRPEHLIRTYHSLDADFVPAINSYPDRDGCLLSGADSHAYPLRRRLFASRKQLYKTFALAHPGYHVNGCETPAFLERLSHYKVSICTSSRYGYALRKIAESTACGCRVISDLPTDEVMPWIDDNIIRVSPTISIQEMNAVIKDAIDTYNPETQKMLAQNACIYYDYRSVGKRLADDIETLRATYCW